MNQNPNDYNRGLKQSQTKIHTNARERGDSALLRRQPPLPLHQVQSAGIREWGLASHPSESL